MQDAQKLHLRRDAQRIDLVEKEGSAFRLGQQPFLGRRGVGKRPLGMAEEFILHQVWQRARERAEELITLSTEQGFSHWLANGTVARGWALVEQGQVEEGLAQMQQGVGFFQAAGIEMGRVDHLPGLAAAYGRVGRVEEGLAVLAEALALADNTGMRVNEAELYRLKGELTLQQLRMKNGYSPGRSKA